MNQPFCSCLADLQSARPFQTTSQSTKAATKKTGNPAIGPQRADLKLSASKLGIILIIYYFEVFFEAIFLGSAFFFAFTFLLGFGLACFASSLRLARA